MDILKLSTFLYTPCINYQVHNKCKIPSSSLQSISKSDAVFTGSFILSNAFKSTGFQALALVLKEVKSCRQTKTPIRAAARGLIGGGGGGYSYFRVMPG